MALSNPYDGPRVPGRRRPRAARRIGRHRRRRRAPRAAAGEPGELRVRTPQMFSAYHGDPAATAASFDDEGRFRTGDTGTRDGDGVVRLLGRTSIDIIKSGGYKLSALEIEAVLLEHPAVAEVAVIGVPDPTWGECVTAWVVARGRDAADAGGAAGVRARAAGPVQAAARAGAGGRASAQRDGEGPEAAVAAPQRQCQESDDEHAVRVTWSCTRRRTPRRARSWRSCFETRASRPVFAARATTLVGAARTVVAMAVEVPAEQEARARQFLQDLEETTGSAGATPIDDVEE